MKLCFKIQFYQLLTNIKNQNMKVTLRPLIRKLIRKLIMEYRHQLIITIILIHRNPCFHERKHFHKIVKKTQS